MVWVPRKLDSLCLSLEKQESLLPRSRNFSSQWKFPIQMMIESIREHDPRCRTGLKKLNLCLSSRVVGIWRFGVSNRQCHCQNCEENSDLCVFLCCSVSLCALRTAFGRPRCMPSVFNSVYFFEFLINLSGTLGLLLIHTGTPGLFHPFTQGPRDFFRSNSRDPGTFLVVWQGRDSLPSE